MRRGRDRTVDSRTGDDERDDDDPPRVYRTTRLLTALLRATAATGAWVTGQVLLRIVRRITGLTVPLNRRVTPASRLAVPGRGLYRDASVNNKSVLILFLFEN